MAQLYKHNTSVHDVTNLTLERMQEFVGGYIEIVCSYSGNTIFVCDEEGKLKGKPINERATLIGRKLGALKEDDYFVGDVIITHPVEIDYPTL